MGSKEVAQTKKAVKSATHGIEPYISPEEFWKLGGPTVITQWRMRRDGILPEPVRISPGRLAWPSSVIKKWLAERPLADVRKPDGDDVAAVESTPSTKHVGRRPRRQRAVADAAGDAGAEAKQ